MAPEVIMQEYGPPADLWSIGMLMYQLLTGTFPFWDSVQNISLQQVRAMFWEETHGSACNANGANTAPCPIRAAALPCSLFSTCCMMPLAPAGVAGNSNKEGGAGLQEAQEHRL